MKPNIITDIIGIGALIALTFPATAMDAVTELQPISKVQAKKVSAATSEIITSAPEGILLEDLEWHSTACLPVNGKATWVESKGFSPTVVVDGTKMFLYSPITQLSEIATAWIEGTIDEAAGKVVFPTPQAYLLNSTQTGGTMMLYATRINAQTGAIEEGNTDLVFDITDEGYIQTDGGLLALTDLNGGFYGYGDKDIVMSYITDEKVVPPVGCEEETYVMTSVRYGETTRQSARIVFDDEDIYISDPIGIEGVWFKGRRDGDKVVVTPGQYLGTLSGFPMYINVAREYTRYETDPLTGSPTAVTDYDVKKDTDLVFTFDEETKGLVCDQMMMVNAGKTERGMAYAVFDRPSYSVWTAAPMTPRKPAVGLYVDLKEYEAYGIRGCIVSFDIYAESEDGEFIPQEDIYYQVCFDGTPLEFYGGSYLPFYLQFSDAETESAINSQGNTHQLQYPKAPKQSLSVQSFYYYEDQLIPSETASYAVVDGHLVDESGVDSIEESGDTRVVKYFGLDGIAAREGKGIRISLTTDGKGKTVSRKILD